MTKKEAQRMEWGTKLVLTRVGKSRFSEKRYEKGAIFLRYNGAGIITVLVRNQISPSSWSIIFWKQEEYPT